MRKKVAYNINIAINLRVPDNGELKDEMGNGIAVDFKESIRLANDWGFCMGMSFPGDVIVHAWDRRKTMTKKEYKELDHSFREYYYRMREEYGGYHEPTQQEIKNLQKLNDA